MTLKQVLEKNEYVQRGYGYLHQGKEYKHWITLFHEGTLQMYSYEDDQGEDIVYNYTTGVVKMKPESLQIFINELVLKDK